MHLWDSNNNRTIGTTGGAIDWGDEEVRGRER